MYFRLQKYEKYFIKPNASVKWVKKSVIFIGFCAEKEERYLFEY